MVNPPALTVVAVYVLNSWGCHYPTSMVGWLAWAGVAGPEGALIPPKPWGMIRWAGARPGAAPGR